jgi:serine/threonine protein kinase
MQAAVQFDAVDSNALLSLEAEMPRPDIKPGVIIAERFRIDGHLGQGGMADVWAATQIYTNKRLALKFLLDASRASVRHRFIREAKAMSAFDHPNVVRVLDVAMLEGGTPFIVMELLKGETLARFLKRRQRLRVEELATIIVPVISAVGAAHAAGVIHRDLKPSNIFLEASAEGVSPRVLDFGIAKLIDFGPEEDLAALTSTGDILGTPHYMAPEQVFGERDLDHRADIWALGVIAFQALHGSRPFRGTNSGQIIKAILSVDLQPLHETVPDVPREVSELVQRMLARARTSRLSDLNEAISVLCRYTAVRAVPFGPPRIQDHVEDDSLDRSEPSSVELVGIRPSDRPGTLDAPPTDTDQEVDGTGVPIAREVDADPKARVGATRDGGRAKSRSAARAALLTLLGAALGVMAWVLITRPGAIPAQPVEVAHGDAEQGPTRPAAVQSVASTLASGGSASTASAASAASAADSGKAAPRTTERRTTPRTQGPRPQTPTTAPRLPGGVYGKNPF